MIAPATPTQVARACLTDKRAAHYLALSFAKLDACAIVDDSAAMRLLRQNARDGMRALAQPISDDTLDKACRILLDYWRNGAHAMPTTE